MRALVVGGMGVLAFVCMAAQYPRFGDVAATETLQVCGSTIQVNFVAGELDLPHADVLRWVRNAGESVAKYYGRFPVKSTTVFVVPRTDRDGVLNGTTWGGHTVRTRMGLGQHTTVAELNDDWTMTHEFVHTAFPDLDDGHHWMEEGLATYIEPIARVQNGLLTQDKVWADMLHDMAKGEPEAGDQGLDHTHTWGRTYWGGAMFFLAADVGIREQTKNRMGLQDALRAIMAAGAIDVDSTPEKAFAVGDRAVGVPVLEVLYAAMKDAPAPVDLDALWRKLGVRAKPGGGVIYDDKASDAAIRKAIMAARPGCKAGA
jgi:hypothetical protein